MPKLARVIECPGESGAYDLGVVSGQGLDPQSSMGLGKVNGCTRERWGEPATLPGQGSKSSIQSDDVPAGVREGRHGVSDGWDDAGSYKGKALPGGGTMGDGCVKDVLSFYLDGVHGSSHLGCPVEGKGNMGS